MTTRPEILYPLFAGLDTLKGVGPKTIKHLSSLNIEKPKDLLFNLPNSAVDRRKRKTLRDIEGKGVATVEVFIRKHVRPAKKSLPYRIEVEDSQIDFVLVFFRGDREYLERIYPVGERRVVSGKVEFYDGLMQMVHPDYAVKPDEVEKIPDMEPIYPLTTGLTQRAMGNSVEAALSIAPEFPEWIDPGLKVREKWLDWHLALKSAHAPMEMRQLSPEHPARERLAYDELFAHQITLALARMKFKRGNGRSTAGSGIKRSKVVNSLPFKLTGAQIRTMREISADMENSIRMNRLLQGDVGSGKTLVAMMSLLIAVEAGGQGVMMAPTEVLARQHCEVLKPMAEMAGVKLEILTSRDKGSRRKAKLRLLEAGHVGILVGTHAVFQKDVVFSDLRLAVVDEQHRFGVRQRLELGKKGMVCDMLIMTATPIPRSLALATYGDMDVSILDEKPPGRKSVKTALININRINDVVNRLRVAISNGQQAYWVCPLVEESEVLDLSSAEERFRHLREALGHQNVGIVHGQMPAEEKDAAMASFQTGKIGVLVATTVIEVGVDVPNASIMVIERAENFGLAQLHQLRGRVGRGTAQSSCILLYQSQLSQGGLKRLQALRETEDGFKIAEVDLEMRGAGDLIGIAQSGLPKYRVADVEKHRKLLPIAQSDARKLLHDDEDLVSERGKAARILLWLMEQEQAIRLINVG